MADGKANPVLIAVAGVIGALLGLAIGFAVATSKTNGGGSGGASGTPSADKQDPAKPAPSGGTAKDPGEVASRNSLLTMPYVRGRKKASASRPDGVSIQKDDRDAYNLVVSAHAPELLLIDITGRTVHRWHCPYEKITNWVGTPGWGDYAPPMNHIGRYSYRWAHLMRDGSVLVLFEDLGIAKLDRDSSPIWAFRGGHPHHMAAVGPDGMVYVLSRKLSRRDMGLLTVDTTSADVIEDSVIVLGPDGTERKRISIVDAFRDSPFASALESTKTKDLMHTNAVHVITEAEAKASSVFRAGHLLLSFRHLNSIAVLDPEARRIVWYLQGMFKAQHDPSIVDNGDVLVFDNRGNGGESRLLQIDPRTRAVRWQYPQPGESGFFTDTCGRCQRLPSGNTLIIESETGRAFEVTPDGDKVWEYFSPHRHNQNIATLYDVRRIDRRTLAFRPQDP